LVLALSVAILPRAADGEWAWVTGLGITSSYDSNVQRAPDGESDFVFEIGPSVGMKYGGTSVNLTGRYNVSANLYARHQSLNQISQNATLDADLSHAMKFMLPRESTIHFKETFYNAPYLPGFESSATSTSDVTTGGVQTPRNTTTRNTFEVNESTPLTQLTQLQLSYVNTYTWYQDPTLIDGFSNEIAMGLSTDLSRIDTLSGTGSYERFDAYGGPVTHIYSLTVEETHEFSPVTKGTGDVGVGYAVLPELTHPQSSFIGGLSGSTRLTKTIRLDGHIGRNFSTSSGIGNAPLISDVGTISIEDRFTTFLTGIVSVNAARNFSLPGLFRIDTHTYETAANLRYRFTTWLECNLRYLYSHQEDFGDAPYKFNRTVVGLNFQAQW
jgi:hypothetical protein